MSRCDGALVRLRWRSRAAVAGVQLSVLLPKRCRKPGPLGLVGSPTPLPDLLWWSGWQTMSAPPGMLPLPFSASQHCSNPYFMRARIPRGSQMARLLGDSSTGGLRGSQMSMTGNCDLPPLAPPFPRPQLSALCRPHQTSELQAKSDPQSGTLSSCLQKCYSPCWC